MAGSVMSCLPEMPVLRGNDSSEQEPVDERSNSDYDFDNLHMAVFSSVPDSTSGHLAFTHFDCKWTSPRHISVQRISGITATPEPEPIPPGRIINSHAPTGILGKAGSECKVTSDNGLEKMSLVTGKKRGRLGQSNNRQGVTPQCQGSLPTGTEGPQVKRQCNGFIASDVKHDQQLCSVTDSDTFLTQFDTDIDKEWPSSQVINYRMSSAKRWDNVQNDLRKLATGLDISSDISDMLSLRGLTI